MIGSKGKIKNFSNKHWLISTKLSGLLSIITQRINKLKKDKNKHKEIKIKKINLNPNSQSIKSINLLNIDYAMKV